MARKVVSLAELKTLDGGVVNAAFDRELMKIAADCTDRPGDSNMRSVALTLSVTPVASDSGVCEFVEMEVSIVGKVPPRRTRVFQAEASAGGHLIVNDASPRDVKQHTLDELTEEMNASNASEGDGKVQSVTISTAGKSVTLTGKRPRPAD